MELLTRKSKATHKIVVLSLTGDDNGKSRSITVSAPGVPKENLLEHIKSILLQGGN